MTKEEVLCILEAPGWALQDVERAYERYERAYSRCTGGAIRYDKEGTSGGGGDPDMPLIIFAERSTELDIAKARYKAAKQRSRGRPSPLSTLMAAGHPLPLVIVD